MRFSKKDATIRYLPEKVSLDQILKQYDNTPFSVVPDGPIVSIARTAQLTLRGWTTREAADRATPKTEPATKEEPAKGPKSDEELPQPILLIVEVVASDGARLAAPAQLTLSNPPAAGLELDREFRRVESPSKSEPKVAKDTAVQWVARLAESVALKPGEIVVPVSFSTEAANDGEEPKTTSRLAVILRTTVESPAVVMAPSGLALVGGALELSLGHLCDQLGCIEHFHKSLAKVDGLGAVRPHPSFKDPRATAYLRAQQAVDVWGLRESLRDHGAEVTGMKPQNLPSFRLRVELTRWTTDDVTRDAEQFVACREQAVEVIRQVGWAKNVQIAGGGINFEPNRGAVDLVELLNAFSLRGTAPRAVWLVPAGVSMPKTAPPQIAGPSGSPKQGGSQINPLVEFNFNHTNDVGLNVLSFLGQQKWASRTQFESGSTHVATLAIADRKYANVMALMHGLRVGGRVPGQIRLREFGDIRIQIEFAHICGDVDYSKPKRKKEKEKDKDKDGDKSKTEAKKPLVPKALRPASTSNGRIAIEAAVAKVGWVKDAVFHDYHTKPHFDGPRKLLIVMQAHGDDVIQVEQLIDALRDVGFPPKSVI
ncbi:MAG: hypothetical protein ABGZ53_12960, partial [Fuerstiella sp.]